VNTQVTYNIAKLTCNTTDTFGSHLTDMLSRAIQGQAESSTSKSTTLNGIAVTYVQNTNHRLYNKYS